ncbi:MAG: histidine kinase dimerization/phospho-acceptor domain-containing protein [Caulobacteraceae bacterium]
MSAPPVLPQSGPSPTFPAAQTADARAAGCGPAACRPAAAAHRPVRDAAELVILAPSLASYEEQRLEERVRAAELASLAVEASPDQVVTDTLNAQLLNGAGRGPGGGAERRHQAPPAAGSAPGPCAQPGRPARARPGGLAAAAVPHAEGAAPADGAHRRQAQLPRRGLRRDRGAPGAPAPRARRLSARPDRSHRLHRRRGRGAGLSVAEPVPGAADAAHHRLDGALPRQSRRSGRPHLALQPPRRTGPREAELDRMQTDLRAALSSRARLAALGEAVAKINHDLRNMLTSAQIASERLALSGDPSVAAALPRLERALDRAAALASNVLDYGKSEERAPSRPRSPCATRWRPPATTPASPAPWSRWRSTWDPQKPP